MRQVASVLLLPVLLMGVTACQSSEGELEKRTSPAGVDATALNAHGDGATERDGTPKNGTRKNGAAVGWVGDTADLGGRTFGEHLQISLRGFVDPAISTRATVRPHRGKRWVGADVSLANVGGRAYASPLTTARVVDSRGTAYRAVAAGDITTGSPLKPKALSAGEQMQGWLVFEVPDNARIVRLDCTVGASSRSWHL